MSSKEYVLAKEVTFPAGARVFVLPSDSASKYAVDHGSITVDNGKDSVMEMRVDLDEALSTGLVVGADKCLKEQYKQYQREILLAPPGAAIPVSVELFDRIAAGDHQAYMPPALGDAPEFQEWTPGVDLPPVGEVVEYFNLGTEIWEHRTVIGNYKGSVILIDESRPNNGAVLTKKPCYRPIHPHRDKVIHSAADELDIEVDVDNFSVSDITTQILNQLYDAGRLKEDE